MYLVLARMCGIGDPHPNKPRPGSHLPDGSRDHLWNSSSAAVMRRTAGFAPAPDTMNPSLWRVAQLNSFSGLFKLVDRLYQVGNIDITNITFIEGDSH
jgi:hypothetical protein